MRAPEVYAASERAMRAQILERLDEFCRGLTLGDVREWYVDSLVERRCRQALPRPEINAP